MKLQFEYNNIADYATHETDETLAIKQILAKLNLI